MAYGDLATLYRIAGGDPGFDLTQALLRFGLAERGALGVMSHHMADAAAWRKRVGEVVGTGRFRGQCAMLVQTATKSTVGRTHTWVQGPAVKGNREIPPGTAIASGWIDGRYPGKAHDNTAAIFLEHLPNGGFACLHQWVDEGTCSGIVVDRIPPRSAAGGLFYVAEMFNVILTVRRVVEPDLERNPMEPDRPYASVLT